MKMKLPLNLPTPHTCQNRVIRSNARYRVVACGRRWGKTVLGERIILKKAVRGNSCWWLAPTYLMADHVWRDLKNACPPDYPGLLISESDRRIDFPSGGSITIRSAHLPDNLRGAGLDFVVLDEAAFMLPDVWPEVVQPMLLDRKGRALFLSSPNGRNWFWELYERGRQNRRGWKSFHYPTAANPHIDPAELAVIRAGTAERIWREEYEGEFLDDLGQVFRGIREAATAPFNVSPIPDGRYVAGLDWGRDADYTAIVIIDADTSAVVALDRFIGGRWSFQRDRLKTLCDRWHPMVIYAESNSIGSPNIEALQAEGLPVRPFRTTVTTKSPLIESLALAIERGQISLLPDDVLLTELAAYRFFRREDGGYKYSAPSGLHDDLVIALALAYHALNHSSPPISFA